MFKKIAAMMIASCMIFSSVAVMAEETDSTAAESTAADAEVTELTWDMMVEANKASDTDILSQGDFVTFDEIACKMWVPSALKQVELTDDDKDAGFIAYFQTDDESAAASVVYADVKGMELEAYAEEIMGIDGVENVELMTVNGLPAVSYDMPENDSTCLSLATEAGYILEFTWSPISDEDYQGIVAIMGASIQPEEEAEAESAASSAESAADSAA